MPGTTLRPLTDEASAAVAKITDAQLDAIIWTAPAPRKAGTTVLESSLKDSLAKSVDELISADWRPMVFPAGKFPAESYRFFADPTETLYTLALAYPHLPDALQAKARARVAALSAADGPLGGLVGKKTYPADLGAIRTAFDPAPPSLIRVDDDIVRSDTARLYPLWLWASVTGDWSRLDSDWPKLRQLIRDQPDKNEYDCGNARISGLIAACRIARHAADQPAVDRLLPLTRSAMRARLTYELAYTEGGLIIQVPKLRTIFGRWRHLTPDIARLLRHHAAPIHHRLMDVYVDHHRPTWFLAWNVELMYRNECPLIFPTASLEIFSARALILTEPADQLRACLDFPWCKADEFFIQKQSLLLTPPP